MADDNETLLDPSNMDPNDQETQMTRPDGVAETVVQIKQSPEMPQKIADVDITGELGRGGMGVVYEGRQSYIDRRVAVKVLLNHASCDQEFTDRFQREAKILAGLNHPNIVACYQAGVGEDENCFLVMEFIEGENLEEYLAGNGALTPEQAIGVLIKIGEALSYAFQNGIIHRDVKPENILLGSESCDILPFTPKLVDLGLARPDASANMQLTAQGVIMGTPATMAPEQFDDPDNVDQRADIYGLGCVLYQALCAERAFSGAGLSQIMEAKLHKDPPDPKKIDASIPAPIAALVKDMLAKDREKRVQNYEELLNRLHELNGASSASSSGGSRNLAPYILAAAVLIIGAIVPIFLPDGAETSTGHAAINAANDPVEQVTDPLQAEKPAEKAVERLPPSELQLLTAQSPADLWWQQVSGNWGRAEEGAGIVGYAPKDQSARLELRPKQVIERFDAVIGGTKDEGKNGAFKNIAVRIYFNDGSDWSFVVSDLEFTITGLFTPPLSSKSGPKSGGLDLSRQWKLSLQRRAGAWEMSCGSMVQKLGGFNQAIDYIEFEVKEGNIFLREAVINTADP